MIRLVFLGTGGMVPTKERNVQSMYLEFKGEGILVDCGEGTQRQMNIAGINRLKVKKVLISHWHGDHVAGLIGLIQTLGNVEDPQSLDIYGPVGSQEYFDHMMSSCSFEKRLDVRLHEIAASQTPETFVEQEFYLLQAAALKHSIPCLGYSFVEKDRRKMNMSKVSALGLREGPLLGKLQDGHSITFNNKTIKPGDVSYLVKGKKITFILDTEPCLGMNNLAVDSDLLVSEANFASDLEEKAAKSKHLTAQLVAQVAAQFNVKKLVLTHFSQRYKSVEALEEDARKVFPDTTCAFDFMQVKL